MVNESDRKSPTDLFSQLRQISLLTRREEQEPAGREMLIRFLDSYNGSGPELPVVDALCARFGLYPYMSTNDGPEIGPCEALAVEIHSPADLTQDNFTFHAEQQHVYQRLMDGASLILSAPTSFGKSAIVDALVASSRWSNLVLIVPTIALIDETRRRLNRFRSKYHIVTHPNNSFGERNLIVLTQERFLEIEALPPVDFFMIDEFYKLSPGGQNDARSALLNMAWNQLQATGAQFYLIGPNIDSLDRRLPPEIHERLVVTSFNTVVVDIEDRSHIEDQKADLVRFLNDETESPTLIFTGSPQKAEDLAADIAKMTQFSVSPFIAEVADWVATNYVADWVVTTALRSGVAIHSGPLPRGIQRLMVRLFNSEMLRTLVCTTTLIEGVNTAAKTVVIFDKKIDNQPIDFFTFSNIRGRAGRMFRHFVGRVVTYMPPPPNDHTSVDIPIMSQSERASDSQLIQLEYDNLDAHAKERLRSIYQQSQLSISTIRKNKGIDPTLQIQAAALLAEMAPSNARIFSWTGPGSSTNIRATLEFAFDNLLEPYQRRRMNFPAMWGQLQNIRANNSNFSAMVEQQRLYGPPETSTSEIVRRVLSFQRNWMGFTIPSMLRTLQEIQAEVLPKRGIPAGNYEFVLREIESLYLPTGISELEEFGLPIPLGLKLRRLGMRGDDVDGLIASLETVISTRRAEVQLTTVEKWIVEDVLDGLTRRKLPADS